MIRDRAWIYCRLSRAQKTDKILSVEEQESKERKRAKANGHRIVGVGVDDGYSAYDPNIQRPGFNEMLEAMSRGEIDYIYTQRADRLARQNLTGELLLMACAANNVILIEDGSEIDATTDDADFFRMKTMMNARESRIKSRRVKDACEVRAHRGELYGGKRPFGFIDERKHGKEKAEFRRHDPKEVAAFRRLFQLVIDGHSLPQIVKLFEAEGIKNTKNERFTVSSLGSLVKSNRAIGNQVHHGTVVRKGNWEPIVTSEVQRKALAALKSRRSKHLKGTKTKRPARLLSSLIICDKCEQPMRVRSAGGTVVYACDRTNNSDACGKSTVTAELAEQEVVEQYLGVLTDPRTHKKLETIRRRAPDTADLADEVELFEMELEALMADRPDYSYSQFKQLHKQATALVEEARERLEKAGDTPALLAIKPAAVLKAWPGWDIEERRRQIARWIEVVRIVPVADAEKKPPEHGDVRRYWLGCTCALCLAANREYNAKRKAGVERVTVGRERRFNPERVKPMWRI